MNTTTYSIRDLLDGATSRPSRGTQTPPSDTTESHSAWLHERHRQAAEERYNRACPERYKDTDWDYPALAPYRVQIDRVRNWQFGPKGMIASGPTGRGKSRAVFDLYRRLACDEGRDVKYYYAGDWFNELQQQVNYGRDEARGWVEASAARPVIILDDLGKQALLTNKEEWAADWFFRFLDLRVGSGLPLIITTNLSAPALAQDMGSRDGDTGDPLMRRVLAVCEPVRF